MDTREIEKWARRFVADLTLGRQSVPLERVIAGHLPMIASLRAAGMTWRAIAALLARAGGRQRDGRPICADQMRANVSRQARRLAARPRNIETAMFPRNEQTNEPALFD